MCAAQPSCMHPYIHVTVLAHTRSISLLDHEVASWLWAQLRGAFPNALAACLMPDHPHVLVQGADLVAARRQLGSVVSALRRSGNPGAAIRWAPALATGPFVTPVKLGRQVRYIALNPSRAGYVKDPLAWLWSTHRDIVGAVSDPWITARRLAWALGRPIDGFRVAQHAYVSGDPSTHVAGTPPPYRAAPTALSLAPVGDVLAAALAATRSVPRAILGPTAARREFLALASAQGWRDAKLLARLCGASERTVYRHFANATPSAASLLCLGDERLRAPLAALIRPFVSQRLTSLAG
jgi:hypothetical protein